ncbi:MAG: Hpt domain-containing protein [Proteobacteria bacterium]|nr:Hpt domain-containing protein [Pseudomonadota bacterium]
MPERAALLEALGDDVQFLAEIIDLFLEDQAKRCAELATALEAQDWKGVVTAAHTLKGALSNFGESAACDRARELEYAAREAQIEALPDHADALDHELGPFCQQLREIRATLSP